MGIANIPLEGLRAPSLNPYQLAAQGQQNAMSAQQFMTGQQQAQQQAALEDLKIQQAQMNNQEQQQQMAAQKAYATSVQQNMSQGPAGLPIIDYSAVAKDLAGQGFGAATQQVITSGIANQRAQYEAAQQAEALHEKKVAALGSIAGSIYDDNSLAVGLHSAVQQGYIDPQTAAQYLGKSYSDLKPQIDQWKTQALTAEQQAQNAQKALDYGLALNEFHQKQLDSAPKTDSEWIKTAAEVAGAAYDQPSLDHALTVLRRQGAPEDVLASFPTTYSPEAKQQISDLGMDAAQRISNKRLDATMDNQRANQQYREDSLDLRRQALQDRKDQTANSQAVDARAAQRDYIKTRAEEDSAYRKAEAIRNLITQSNGQQVLDKATQEPRDLGQEYADAVDEIKKITADKYDAAARAGQGAPSIPLGDVYKNLDDGRDKLLKRGQFAPGATQSAPNPNPATQPKPEPKQTPQKFTEEQVRARAKAAGIDPDVAVKAAREAKLIQ